ncbi:hypothetical protein [Anaeromyxobacter sp. SG17]|uniref:hypothetical protein n=1 Tax=Anaeromyxobacter sp. SG17 TaxID=2925405 RepID=UPI001F581D40|nr:hypothetical protein [Anaeromyxobacter sp. SG17]
MSKKTKAAKKTQGEPIAMSAAPESQTGNGRVENETRSLVVEDYADQPKAEQPAPEPTAPVATAETSPASEPQPAAPAKVEKPSKSTIEKPTKAVWTIADEMKKADPAVTRKAIVDECMHRGIAYYTARTQAQLWSKKQG